MSYKLIRDSMPAMIAQYDPQAVTIRMYEKYPQDEQMGKWREYLMDKLREEVAEAVVELNRPQIDREKLDEELGDVLEVLRVLSGMFGYDAFEHIAEVKAKIRGSFWGGCLLDTRTGKMPVGE